MVWRHRLEEMPLRSFVIVADGCMLRVAAKRLFRSPQVNDKLRIFKDIMEGIKVQQKQAQGACSEFVRITIMYSYPVKAARLQSTGCPMLCSVDCRIGMAATGAALTAAAATGRR